MRLLKKFLGFVRKHFIGFVIGFLLAFGICYHEAGQIVDSMEVGTAIIAERSYSLGCLSGIKSIDDAAGVELQDSQKISCQFLSGIYKTKIEQILFQHLSW